MADENDIDPLLGEVLAAIGRAASGSYEFIPVPHPPKTQKARGNVQQQP